MLKTEVTAVLILVTVVGGLGFASSAGTASQQDSSTTSGQTPANVIQVILPSPVCGNGPRYSGPQMVMILKPGSFGTVCVVYGIGSAQQESESWVVQQVGSVYLLGASGMVFDNAGGINITILSVSRTQSEETVEYSMTASSGSDGAYVWWLTGSSCPGFPLVVGSNVTGELPSLRSYFSEGFECPATSYAVEIDGVSGVTVQAFS